MMVAATGCAVHPGLSSVLSEQQQRQIQVLVTSTNPGASPTPLDFLAIPCSSQLLPLTHSPCPKALKLVLVPQL